MLDSDRKKRGRLLSAAPAQDRGYASFFDWPNKTTKEVHIATRFASSRSQDGGFAFDQIRPGPDPPDCEAADSDGALVGIEVTELVDEQAIRATKKGTPLLYAAWPRDKVVATLQKLIERKSNAKIPSGRYKKYLLLVHTDETLLDIEYLRESLGGVVFTSGGCLTDAYLLVSYDPRLEKCPYLRLSLSQES